MRNISLVEYGDVVRASLTEEEERALRRAGAEIEINFTRDPGVYALKAANIVGTVVLPRSSITIVPKVSTERLLHLVGLSPELLRVRGTARAAESADFISAVRFFYAAALSRLVRTGLRREYFEETADCVAVRGRLRMDDLIFRRFGIFPPIRCDFHEYALDSEANRRLLAAARILARSGDPSDSASSMLRSLLPHFQDVGNFTPSQSLVPIIRTHLVKHYDPALSIAEIVLRNLSWAFAEGPNPVLAFLVDMNKVYENYVTL